MIKVIYRKIIINEIKKIKIKKNLVNQVPLFKISSNTKTHLSTIQRTKSNKISYIANIFN